MTSPAGQGNHVHVTAVARAVVAPLGRRVTYTRLGYLLLSPLLGTIYFVFLATGITVGVGLLLVWVGVPVLLGVLGLSRRLAGFERAQVNALLGSHIATPRPRPFVATGLEGMRMMLTDSTTWRSVLWLVLRVPLGLLTSIALTTWTLLVAALVGAPVLDRGDGDWWPIPGWFAWLAVPVLVVGLAHLVEVLAVAHAGLAALLLAPPESEQVAILREQAEELAERNRLARELHDSVGHTLTVGVLQATAAERVFDADPAFAREALGTIAQAGRGALGELDRVLGALRNDADATPSPGLGALDALAASTQAAGLPLALRVSGDTTAVPGLVSREAYRIIQEALTNVLRHAGLVPTTVGIDVGRRSLGMIVENESAERPVVLGAIGRGRGLRGVGERVHALGGTLDVGPTPTGGFRLAVLLPVAGR